MVVAVTGSSGQLGQAIQSISGNYPDIDFRFLSKSSGDITNRDQIRQTLLEIKPDFCINAAAFTAVDRAEQEHKAAFDVNLHGAINVTDACSELDITLIQISTDFVFDGNIERPYIETDIPNPLSVYGKSKFEAEKYIQAIHPKHFIIRASWIYSKFGSNFLKTMLRLASEKSVVKVVNDQKGTPTHALDLADLLCKIVKSKSSNYGIYHFSNEGHTSWCEFAREIFRAYELPAEVRPVSTAEYNAPAKRPLYSVFDKTKIKNEFGLQIPVWTESILK